MRSFIVESAIFYGEKHAQLDKHVKRAEGNSMKNLILSGIETARKELVQLEEKLNCKNTKFESCSVACMTGVRVRLGARLGLEPQRRARPYPKSGNSFF